MRIVHPSEVKLERAGLAPAPERVLILLPSPFVEGPEHREAVVIFPDNNSWIDRSGHQPRHIPGNPLGFVMAFDGCNRDEAMEKLRELASEINGVDAEDLAKEMNKVRAITREYAEAALRRADAAKPDAK
jgi:hypothetical protein